VPFRTPFPTAYFTSSLPLPFCLCAIFPHFATSFVMSMVSAQREVLRFVGMGADQKSLSRSVDASTVTSLQYTRDFVTSFTSDW